MGECYIGLEKYEEAEAAVRKALDMKDDLPSAHYNLALILEERGNLHGAAEAYEKTIELAPKDFKAHFNLAKVFGRIGRLEKQMEHFEKAIEVNKNFAVGYLYLSKMYLDRGDLEKASSLAKKGIELGPEPSMAPLGHYILADVYNRLGRLQDAEREVAIARRLERSGS
jgi:tetratricopeptide (TPR) repeat protein